MESSASHIPPELCVGFLLLNLPSLSQRFIKDNRKGLKQCHGSGAPLGQHTTWMFYAKTQCCYPKAQQLGNMPWVVSPGIQKSQVTCVISRNTWIFPKYGNMSSHTVPEMPAVNQNFLSAHSAVSFVFDNRLADTSPPENLSVQSDFCWEHSLFLHFVHVPSFCLQGPLCKN